MSALTKKVCQDDCMLHSTGADGLFLDSTIRDVTPRYAKGYNVSTVKSRVPSKKGTDWFAELIKPYARDFLLVSIAANSCCFYYTLLI